MFSVRKSSGELINFSLYPFIVTYPLQAEPDLVTICLIKLVAWLNRRGFIDVLFIHRNIDEQYNRPHTASVVPKIVSLERRRLWIG